MPGDWATSQACPHNAPVALKPSMDIDANDVIYLFLPRFKACAWREISERPLHCIEQKVIDLFRTPPLGQHFLAATASVLHIDLSSKGRTSIETASSSNLSSEVSR